MLFGDEMRELPFWMA